MLWISSGLPVLVISLRVLWCCVFWKVESMMFVVFVAFYSFGLKTSTKNGRLWEKSTVFFLVKTKDLFKMSHASGCHKGWSQSSHFSFRIQEQVCIWLHINPKQHLLSSYCISAIWFAFLPQIPAQSSSWVPQREQPCSLCLLVLWHVYEGCSRWIFFPLQCVAEPRAVLRGALCSGVWFIPVFQQQ